jgi:hypothetical protein
MFILIEPCDYINQVKAHMCMIIAPQNQRRDGHCMVGILADQRPATKIVFEIETEIAIKKKVIFYKKSIKIYRY